MKQLTKITKVPGGMILANKGSTLNALHDIVIEFDRWRHYGHRPRCFVNQLEFAKLIKLLVRDEPLDEALTAIYTYAQRCEICRQAIRESVEELKREM